MTRRITKAIATHQAATTPAAVRRALKAFKGREYAHLISASDIRFAAAHTLHEALAAEMDR